MTRGLLKLTASALLLTAGAAASHAQQGPGPMMQQDQPDMMQQDDDSPRAERPAREVYPDWHGKRNRRDRDWQDRDGDRMMRGHMMGGPGMMRMMVILMDADGDGALSLEEVQAVHARIFKAIDTDGDNRVTPAEIRDFFSSLRGRGR